MPGSFEGKKVFFVYPHSVFQENLIQRLVDQEFEIYILNNHEQVNHVLELFPDAVIFFNIDKGLSRQDWEVFIRGLLEDRKGDPVSIGILSYEYNKSLAERYLMDMSIPCGYIQLKQKLDDAANIISKTLIANEVKSRRKYVRFQAGDNSRLKLNANISGNIRNGLGIDISSAGMAIVFDEPEVDIPKNTLLSDIQLTLSGRRVRVSGAVLGFRQESAEANKIFVVVFDKRVESEVRGVWTYENTWYWGSASGRIDGVPFGFNIGCGFGDTSAATENILFYNGRGHKLEDVMFHIPGETEGTERYLDPWRFSSSDGRLELDFVPVLDRSSEISLGILKSRQHQVFGNFSGKAVLDNGRTLDIREFHGFAEKVFNRW